MLPSITIVEGPVWRYFNCPDPYWSEKCSVCRRKISETREPCPECVNCWKIEVWEHGKAYPRVDFDRLMDELHLRAGFPIIAKASRGLIQVVRTGVPLEGYSGLPVDGLLLLYGRSIGEREVLRELVREVLGLSQGEAGLIPVRRGCWRFDSLLGPWQSWYPVDSDWPENPR